MVIIKEYLKETEVIYKKIYSNSNNEEHIVSEVNISRGKVKHEGYEYLLLYSSKMQLISEVFRYVNVETKNQSINTRSGILTALKFLYSFAELFDLNIKSLSKDDAIKFKSFLYGLDIEGSYVKIKTITERTSDTINQYFSVYRNFLAYIGVHASPFHEKGIVRLTKGDTGMMAHGEQKVVEKYTLQDPSQKQSNKVPMYIKHNEIEEILKIIRRDYTLREEIIVMLMYTCGMRLGEVLGLTLEDLGTSLDNIKYRSLLDLGTIIIRNRLTDKDDQLAKTCLIPKDKSDYSSKKYTTENAGYQVVHPTINILRKIEQYVEETHGAMSKVKRKNYLLRAKADMVVPETSLTLDENFYIFLNKNGTPLGKKGWNKILREIYLKSNINVDTGKREHNLSHRLRHGYAMFLVKFQNYNSLQLMEALRHSSLASVSYYFRPDDDDLLESNIRATETMFELIPALRE